MKIIIKAMAGSHLFGTSTPQSDKDYKGVFIPTAEEILTGDYSESVSTTTGQHDSKNSKEDIDIELYSVKKFFKMIRRGDTAALELLFTPEHLILEKDPMWDYIMEHRDKLLSSKVNAMIGYARQQANKYGIKGSRMGTLNNVLADLKEIEKTFDFQNPKLKHGWELIQEKLGRYEHVEFIMMAPTAIGTPEVPGIDVLGKKFDHHVAFNYIIPIFTTMYKNFGQRAREAKKNNGIDWKALSHAARVSIQGLELLNTGKITLPLIGKDANMVRAIKAGEVDYKDVSELLTSLLEELEAIRLTSHLPEEVDKSFTDAMLIELHKGVINANFHKTV